MIKESKYSVEYFLDYLREAKSIDDYQERLKELTSDQGLSDFAVSVFNAKAETIEHFQTAPSDMFADTAIVDDCNLVPLHAVKKIKKPMFLSDLEKFVTKNDENRLLFSGFISVFNIIQSYGFCDYYNVSTKLDCNSTLMLSVAQHDLKPWQFNELVGGKSITISHLLEAIASSLPRQAKIKEILSPRELRALQCATRGMKYREIAKTNNISVETVKKQLLSARIKTGVASTKLLIARSVAEQTFN